MIYRLGCAALIAVAATAPASAQTYEVWGVGNKTCGAWTDMERTNKDKYEAFQSWAHGFLTGAGYGRSGLKIKAGAKIEPESLVKAVDEYCLKNPRMTVERAAVDTLNTISEEPAK